MTDYDDYDSGHDADAAQGAITSAWHEALEWAERGDRTLLVQLLRSDLTLQDDTFIRQFLADYLDGTYKTRRGKPPTRPRGTFATGDNGEILWIDERDKKLFEIRRWISQNKQQHGDQVTSEAAKHFEMDEEALINLVRRSAKSRKAARSS